MSMYGCYASLSIPATGFPYGYVIYRYDVHAGGWMVVFFHCTGTGFEAPPPTTQGFPNECRVVQCQAFRVDRD